MDGGAAATPEFLAVLLGLVLYTAAFIAEVVRAGIQSVSHGQGEAAAALGLTRGPAMRLVMLPQALRVIIPPMTNQYLNLTKNSSLAVAIGYPDVVSIANTSLNQTGRAVECIAIIMAGLPDAVAGHLGVHELVQPPRGDQGALSMSAAVFKPIAAARRARRDRRAGAVDPRQPVRRLAQHAGHRAARRAGRAAYVPGPARLGAAAARCSQPDADACQAARGIGACWGVVAEKYRLIIFGRYPYEEQWRPLLATLLLVGAAGRELHARVLEALAGRCCGSRCSPPSSC